jgi:hypothetical protein
MSDSAVSTLLIGLKRALRQRRRVPKDINPPQNSLDTLLKSTSLIIVLFSATLYIVGAAVSLQTSHLLGLAFLAQPSKEQYLFTGFKTLLAYLAGGFAFVFGIWMALRESDYVRKCAHFLRRRPEISALAAIAFGWATLFGAQNGLADPDDKLTVAGAALSQFPVPNGLFVWMGLLASAGLLVVATAALYVYPLLPSRIWRFCFLYACLVTESANLFSIGKAEAFSSITEGRYNLALLAGTSAIHNDRNVLVLGSDEKNLVVLAASSPGKRAVIYISRSEIKSISVTGTASLSTFLTGHVH